MQIEKLLEEQEKEFEDRFGEDTDQIVSAHNGWIQKEIWNWHKQSLKQFIDGLVEETDKMIVNRPEKLITLNAHLDSTTRDNSYNNAVGYCQAVDKFVSHLKEIRAKLV